MKPDTRLRSFLLLAGSSLLAFSPAYAADYYWDSNGTTTGFGNTSGTWGTSDFWSTEILGTDTPANTTITNLDDVFFGTAANAYAGTVTTNAALEANSISFGGTGAVTLSGIGTITLGNGTAGQGGITRSGGGATQVNTNITLANSQTWTNSGAGLLIIDNGGNRLLDMGANDLTLSGGININQNNDTFTSLAGSGTLTKTGSGLAMIRGNNTGFTGDIVITGGSLGYGAIGSLGSGNIEINGGVLESRWQNNFNYAQGAGDGQVQITGGESGFALNGATGVTFNIGAITWGSATFKPTKFILQNENSQGTSNITLTSAINMNGATRTIVAGSGTTGAARAIISGAISNSTGTAGLTKEGNGRLFLTNITSSWNGNTTVSAGMLDMGGINLANITGGTGRNINVADGASIRFNALSNAALNRLVETTDEIGVMTGATSNNLDFSSSTGANLANAFLGNYASNNAKAEYNGTITPGSDGYKLGAIYSNGNLGIRQSLTGNNTLTVGQTGGSNIRVTLAAANTHTGETVINTGAKLNLGNNLALQNSALNVGSAGGNIAFNGGTGAATITGNLIADSPTFGGLIGSRNLSSVFTNASANNESNLTANLITGFTLNVADGETFTYSGAIGGFGTGTTSNTGGGTGGNSTLTKTGLGTQILSGNHTYTGATNINQGTLVINGSTSSTSLVSVASGATLGGDGTVGGNTTISGIHSPGNSPGIQEFTNDLEYTASSSVTWELTASSLGLRGTDFDGINVGGDLDFAGATTLNLVFNFAGSGVNWANSFWSTSHTGTSGWLVYDVTGITSGIGNLTVNTTNWLDGSSQSFDSFRSGNTFSLYQDGDDIYLNYNVIPEPRAALLCGLGVLALLRRRRTTA